MKWLPMTFLFSLLACTHAVELSKEEILKIIVQPSSDDVVAELQLYPAGKCRFTLKVNLANGTADLVEYSAQQRYVDGKYVVVSPKSTNAGIPLHMVRAYDPQLRLFYGWDVYADGTILNQSGMYDSERKIMSWFGDNVVQEKHLLLRSIQSFADRSLITWKVQTYWDNRLQLEAQGECQSISTDHQQ